MSFSFALEEIETTLMTKSTMLTPDDWYNHGLSKLTELAIERAEQRAAQLQAERDELTLNHVYMNERIVNAEQQRDTAAYQARMEAARMAYDEAIVFEKSPQAHAALMNVFHDIAGEYAEKKS